MRRALGHIAHTTPGVSHIEIDAVDEPDLVKSLGITQTPTTLLVAASGDIVTWIRGAASEASVRQAIDEAKRNLHLASDGWAI